MQLFNCNPMNSKHFLSLLKSLQPLKWLFSNAIDSIKLIGWEKIPSKWGQFWKVQEKSPLETHFDNLE